MLVILKSDVDKALAALNSAYAALTVLVTQASNQQKLTQLLFDRAATLSDEVKAINAISTFWGSNFPEILARADLASKEAYTLGQKVATLLGVETTVMAPPVPPKGPAGELFDFLKWGLYIAGGYLAYSFLRDSGVFGWSRSQLAPKSNKHRRR